MLYNIYFELAALIIMLIVLMFHVKQYKSETKVNVLFRRLVIESMITVSLDSISAVTISYWEHLPVWLNIFLIEVSFAFLVHLGYVFSVYVENVVLGPDSTYRFLPNKILFILYLLSAVANMFCGFYFYFDSTGYHHGEGFIYHNIIALYYVVYTALFFIAKHKKLDMGQVLFTSSYVGIMFLCAVLQMTLLPNILITGFGIGISVLILLFSLETPDYEALKKTLAELEISKAEANRVNEAKSAFLANMSHEIRTPLNAILGMDEMIIRDPHSDSVLEFAYNIKNAGINLLGIINDILDFSKIESGKMELVEDDYNLSTMLNDIVNMIEIKVKDRKDELDFILDIDEELPEKLFGDYVRVKQVILNVLSNAVKYTRKGSVTMKITGSDSARNPYEKILCIEITDTGIGIKQEDMDKLFSDFQRLSIKENRNIEGTGLGLAITSRLLKQMNGSIEVESEYGKGSKFTIKIPQVYERGEVVGNFREKNKENITNIEKYHESFTAPSASVLITDDNELNLVVAEQLLKGTKIDVDKCNSGFELLKKIQTKKYDVILLDHMMPGIDGIETLAKMRQDKYHANQDTPVIAMTANAISGAREKYISSGFVDYISKPINPNILERTLLQYIPEDKIKHEEALQSGEEIPSSDNEKIASVDETASPDNDNIASGKSEKVNEYIDKHIGLQYCGDSEEFYQEMLEMYLKQYEAKESELNEAVWSRDWKAYSISVHALKSNSGTIGAVKLQEKALELEMLSKKLCENINDEDEAKAYSLHEKLLKLYADTIDAVQALM